VAWERGYSTKTDGGNGMGMRLLTDVLASYCQYMTQSILPGPSLGLAWYDVLLRLEQREDLWDRELHSLHSGNAFTTYVFNEPITVE